MKKYIGLMTLLCALMFVTSVYAVTGWTNSNCEDKGGTTVTVGTQTFCKSGSTMNWWSAYSWCEAMGGKMPTIWELCPNAASIVYNADCQSYYGVHVLSATPGISNDRSWYVNSGYRMMNDGTRNDKYGYAYCLPSGLASN